MKNFLTISIFLLAMMSFSFVPNSGLKKSEIVVVIDVSHGGEDLGVSVSSISEKELVQQIAARIGALNDNSNLKIHFTRTSDFTASLQQRVDFINDLAPDLVISLHINKSEDEEQSGTELYVSKKSTTFETSYTYAKGLQSELMKSSLQNVRIKNADFFILRKSEHPAILMQLGYLTNSTDRKLLVDPAIQDTIANSIVGYLSKL